MAEAFAWGIVAGSSLVLGGIAALLYPIGRRALGLVMAFGAGVLISAVAFELVHEAFETTAGDGGVGLGLIAGSFVFFVGDTLIDRMGGHGRKASSGEQASGSAFAIGELFFDAGYATAKVKSTARVWHLGFLCIVRGPV